jgi:hypothetical protein
MYIFDKFQNSSIHLQIEIKNIKKFRASKQKTTATTTGIRGIAVRPRRTAKAIKHTAKILPCVFLENARQRAHGSKLHGKRTLPCAFYRHARQSYDVRQFRRTAKNFEIH